MPTPITNTLFLVLGAYVEVTPLIGQVPARGHDVVDVPLIGQEVPVRASPLIGQVPVYEAFLGQLML